MRVMKSKSILLAVFLSVFVFSFFNIANADDHLHKVSGTVTGCSSKHAVHVLIYEEAGFKGMNHSQENIYSPTKGADCSVDFSMEFQLDLMPLPRLKTRMVTESWISFSLFQKSQLVSINSAVWVRPSLIR
jgi:hypothetical protein